MARILDVEAALLLLELEPPFDQRMVQLARRRMAKRWHPDIAPPGRRHVHQRHLQAINEAADELAQLAETSRSGSVSASASAVRASAANRRARDDARRRAYENEQRARALAQDRAKHNPIASFAERRFRIPTRPSREETVLGFAANVDSHPMFEPLTEQNRLGHLSTPDEGRTRDRAPAGTLLYRVRARLATHGLTLALDVRREGWSWDIAESPLTTRRLFRTVSETLEHADAYTAVWYREPDPNG